MHARLSPTSLTFQLAFNNRQAYQVIPLFAVAIYRCDAVMRLSMRLRLLSRCLFEVHAVLPDTDML